MLYEETTEKEGKMLRRNVWVVVCLCIGWMGWVGCTSTDPNANTPCKTSSDCKKSERCIRNECKPFVKTNNPPVASVGKNQRVRLTSTVELDGSLSKDPDGDALTFDWVLYKRPIGSKISIQNADKKKASLKADVPGLYVVQLVVKDTKGLKSRPARTEIEFYGKDENGDPIASAGADSIGCLGEDVSLDGTRSTDPDGDKLTYEWAFTSKPKDSQAQLDDPTTEKPRFTADKAGKYILSLIVSDGLESSPPDTISIQVLSDCKLEPKITKVTPNSGYIESQVPIQIRGTGFSEQASVLFNGNVIPEDAVKFVDPTELQVRLSLMGVTPKEYSIVVRNPNQKKSNAVPFTAKDLPIPTLKKLLPATGVSGAKMEIKAEGIGFTKRSEALFNLVPLKTKFISETELSFMLDLSQTLPGMYKVKIQNPGGRASKELEFKVIEPGPAPILNVLNPPSGQTGKKLPFSVHGVGFSPGAEIYFDGKKLASKRIRRDEIQAASDLDLTNIPAGAYDVYVRNPDGKISNKQKFVVDPIDPTPILDRILPFFIYLDDSSNTLAVYGSRFLKGLKLKIGTQEITGANIIYKSSTYFEAKVDTTKGTWAEGDQNAIVVNPNGKSSKPFKVTVTYRLPSISSITPNAWTTGCDTQVTISGNNFIKLSEVAFGKLKFTTTSTTHPLTFVNDQTLTLNLKKAALPSGSHTIQVINATKAKSTTMTFRITEQASVPTPEIREVRPSAARADTKVSVIMYYNGSNRFWNGAIVYLNGKAQKTTCSSSSSTCYNLGAELDLTGLKPGKHNLTVKNPCGKASATFPFYVAPAPKTYISSISPAFARPGDKKKFVVTGLNFSKNAQISWGGQLIPTTWKSNTELITTNSIDFASAKAGDVIDVFVDNKNGQKTATFKFSILDKKATLYITSLSASELERGIVHNGLQISGGGFTKTSEVYFNGNKVTTKFATPFQLIADGIDLKTLPAGTYPLYVKDGANQSNTVVLLAKPRREPILDYIRPAVLIKGTSARMYVYGKYFCEMASATSRSCVGGSYKVLILDPSGKDVSSSFAVTRAYGAIGWSYSGYVYGQLNSASWSVGDYKVYFELPTGERSIAAILQIKPPPPPTVTELSPSGIRSGDTKTVRIRGSYLVKGASVLIGLQSFITTGGSTSGSSYIDAVINATSGLQPGSHQLIVQNPDGQMSKPIAFTIYPKDVVPLVQYTSPDVAYSGYSGSLYVYGDNITSTTKLEIDGKAVSAQYRSSRGGYLYASSWKAPTSTKSYSVQLVEGTKKSNVFKLGNAGGKGPFIRYISPDNRSSSLSTYRLSMYIYGFAFGSNSVILLDGQSYTPAYRGSSYIRLSQSISGYKNYTVQVRDGLGNVSNKAIFSFVSSTGMRISYASPSSVLAGETKYDVGRARISGSKFTANSVIYLNNKALKTTFVSSTRLTVNEVLDFTTNTKAELWHWEVRDGAKKSNTRALRIETPLSRLNRPRFSKVEPYVISLNKKVTLRGSGSYLYSSSYSNYQVVIEKTGFSKTFPITGYVGGRFTIPVDTTGWTVGTYNVYVENKVTKQRSGGNGLYVIK